MARTPATRIQPSGAGGEVITLWRPPACPSEDRPDPRPTEPRVSGWYLGTVEILVAEQLGNPEEGFGLQQVVLEEVASAARGPTALVWTSTRYVGVTRSEMRLPGFEAAAKTAENLGFVVLARNSGGGAVAANEGSISFSLTFPVEELHHGLFERYAEGVDLLAVALRRVGVEAEGGEVEGEFCPGAHSVRSGGPQGVKHAGLAQRVTRRAARLEALILVSRTVELVPVLSGFYGALGLHFRPESVGDLPVGVPRVIEALVAEVGERYGVEESRAGGGGTLEKARSLRGQWRVSSEARRPGAACETGTP
jgi:octanoyl-[GcvH]:protein N-octanoyltransferase